MKNINVTQIASAFADLYVNYFNFKNLIIPEDSPPSVDEFDISTRVHYSLEMGVENTIDIYEK